MHSFGVLKVIWKRNSTYTVMEEEGGGQESDGKSCGLIIK